MEVTTPPHLKLSSTTVTTTTFQVVRKIQFHYMTATVFPPAQLLQLGSCHKFVISPQTIKVELRRDAVVVSAGSAGCLGYKLPISWVDFSLVCTL